MASDTNNRTVPRRKDLLDLPSLERDCMRALWPLREATVRQVQMALAEHRPRAYTTVMTILLRLAQKGIVIRRKVGRAWLYAPNVSVQQARTFALGQLVQNFFDGSEAELQEYLSGTAVPRRTPTARVVALAPPAAETMATSSRVWMRLCCRDP
ncbi:MAG: BlaI/MecI/CopY family transcriptional regulator [Acidobacteria bacterium]|nr:BlaI/MecI/CopY family transcriptional regulator [Acidobacteriota bacterium]